MISDNCQLYLGGDEGDRTPDLRNAITALSQLSYVPKLLRKFKENAKRELLNLAKLVRFVNSRAGKAGALGCNAGSSGEGACVPIVNIL